MGADGHVMTVPVSQVPAEFGDLLDNAQRLTGWARHELHGSEPFLWSYWSTSSDYGYSLSNTLDELRDYERHLQRVPKGDAWVQTQARVLRYREIIERDGGIELAERALAFRQWLEGNASDWEVWT